VENYAKCGIKKDGGDDCDATSGALIFARVSLIPNGFEITGGKGVGIVTKAGLDRPVGEFAINSVPRKMITREVLETAEKYGYSGGFRVEISVPDGEEIAKKTYNPRMGIEGGISIIGTSGIVEPMSNSALIETIRVEAKMRRAEGYKNLLLTLGNYSESFIQRSMPFALQKSVKCSNFIGEAIDIALQNGFLRVLIIGHIGKLVKLGAGIMNTHSAQADGRMEVLVTCGLLAGADSELLKKLPDCATVDAALEILKSGGYMEKTLEILAKRAEYYLNAKVKNSIEIGAVMFSDKLGVRVKTSLADRLITLISEEYNG
ncbi:MAG: cobalt-precorrin-5B (C(1))-methyltransferase CbiD, partial [Ruminiclostridium sp.]